MSNRVKYIDDSVTVMMIVLMSNQVEVIDY